MFRLESTGGVGMIALKREHRGGEKQENRARLQKEIQAEEQMAPEGERAGTLSPKPLQV